MDRVDLTNRQLGIYRILHRLGSGGMSDVYLAFHENLHRHVAIKVMRMDLANSPEHVKRFLQEARSAASMVHPNIVQVYDVGEQQNLQYIAQEYIAGCTLRDYIQRVGSISLNETISILMQVSAALSKSASIGIVHRDIKPDNILLTPDGEVKVADFGLSRAHTNKEHLTEIGIALGTPTYMSPEQVQGQPVDIRSDLYSLGVTAYHMLAGRPPFEGETALALAVQHVQNKPADLAKLRPDLPEKLVEIVHRLLAKKAEDRFVSPNELNRALRDVAENLPAPLPTDRPLPLPNVVVDAVAVGEHTSILDKAALKQRLVITERKRRLLMASGVLAAAILAGFGTYYFVVTRPVKELLPELTPAQLGIERKNTVREQYVLALLKDSPTYWTAVELYFPPESSSLAEAYCMKAWLHLAWNALRREKPAEAEPYLQKIAKTSSADQVIDVLYHAARYWQASLDTDLTSSATDESKLFRMKFSQLLPDQQRIVREALPQQARSLMDST
jgi:serine/threonine-protein kinase